MHFDLHAVDPKPMACPPSREGSSCIWTGRGLTGWHGSWFGYWPIDYLEVATLRGYLDGLHPTMTVREHMTTTLPHASRAR